jgi:hypothetical protein
VKVAGEKATAVLVHPRWGQAPVVFLKVAGKWKLAPELRTRG